jgi:ubiquinone/menaquinone biosynthesis C-methylase UbiE
MTLLTSKYVFGNSKKEIERLNIQSTLFEKETIRTLNIAGIKQGMRCLDAGCGLGHTSLLMGERVGKHGKVIGLDINKDNINTCKKNLGSINHNNLEFVVGDLNDTIVLKDQSFDFVYSRFLFQHLIDPQRTLAKVIKLTYDGGIIAIEELDHGLWLSHPPDPNLRRLQKAYAGLLRLSGSDPFVARKLYGMFLKNNLKPNIAAYSVCVKMNDQPFNMMGVLMAEVLKDSILKNDLMTLKQFYKMLAGLKEYAMDPTGLVLYAIAFRIWVRKESIT